MATVTFNVTLVVDGDPREMDTLFGQYLTNADGPFAADYGSGWGGYEGPFVTHVMVQSVFGPRYESDDSWPKPDRGDD